MPAVDGKTGARLPSLAGLNNHCVRRSEVAAWLHPKPSLHRVRYLSHRSRNPPSCDGRPVAILLEAPEKAGPKMRLNLQLSLLLVPEPVERAERVPWIVRKF
jgi:hypothetical protein